jgi:hypothetical protein
MTNSRLFILYIVGILASSFHVLGQSTLNDLFDRRLNSDDIWTKTDQIQGHPFILEDWEIASIETLKGTYNNVPVKLNVERNEVYFKDENGKTLILQDDFVTELSINDSKNNSIRRFIKIPLKGYFEMITEGKSSLLIKHSKLFVPSIAAESVNTITNKSMDRYNEKAVVTIRIENQLYPLENKKALKSLYSDDVGAAEFIRKNKVKTSDIDSMVTLVNYLNSRNP